MIQNFCKELGFGSKGYSIIRSDKKSRTIVISGNNVNYKYFLEKLKKNLGKKPLHFRIDNKRFSINYINEFSNKLKKINPEKLIALGGGSIIDFSKRIFLNLKKKNKKTLFYIFPSIPGSGSESSITSIINHEGKKNFLINNKFIPDGIIYDDNLINTCKKNKVIMGVIDAFSHCIESTTTINKNYYLNFLSYNTINYFINKNSYKLFSYKKKIKNYNDINLLSFNGGLAQSNAGSGICHALSHVAEEILNINHSKCITFFILPTLDYLNNKNKKDLKDFDFKLVNYIRELVKLVKKKENFSKLNSLISDEKKIEKLIKKSQNDLCWRLYKNNIDITLLKKCLLNAKY